MNLPLTRNLLVATCFLHSYLITEVWDVLHCFFFKKLRTLTYRSFISSGANMRALEFVFLTVCSKHTVLGSDVPSLEDKDFSAVDSEASIFIFSIFGDFLMPIELGFNNLTFGMLIRFLGSASCSLSAFLNKSFDYGNTGIIFPGSF